MFYGQDKKPFQFVDPDMFNVAELFIKEHMLCEAKTNEHIVLSLAWPGITTSGDILSASGALAVVVRVTGGSCRYTWTLL